jgi:hypothetical protein
VDAGSESGEGKGEWGMASKVISGKESRIEWEVRTEPTEQKDQIYNRSENHVFACAMNS